MDKILSIVQWRDYSNILELQDSKPLPVKSFQSRQPSNGGFKIEPRLDFFSRAKHIVLPTSDPTQYTIVAAWERTPGLLPAPFMHPECIHYNSPQELIADNISCLAFIKYSENKEQAISRRTNDGENNLNIVSILDFVDREAVMPSEFVVETASESCYSTNKRDCNDIKWIGVLDFIPEFATDPARANYLVSTSIF